MLEEHKVGLGREDHIKLFDYHMVSMWRSPRSDHKTLSAQCLQDAVALLLRLDPQLQEK